MDVTDLGQITAAVDKAASYFGRIDILVNNAGLGPGIPPRKSTSRLRSDGCGEPEGDVLRQPEAAGRVMIRQKYGRIINLSSQAGFAALPSEGDLLHAPLAGWHLASGDEVSGGRMGQAQHHRERCRADVHFDAGNRPGAERPEVPRLMCSSGSPDFTKSASRTTSPAPVVFLASPSAAMITGDTIMIDGGWTARQPAKRTGLQTRRELPASPASRGVRGANDRHRPDPRFRQPGDAADRAARARGRRLFRNLAL